MSCFITLRFSFPLLRLKNMALISHFITFNLCLHDCVTFVVEVRSHSFPYYYVCLLCAQKFLKTKKGKLPYLKGESL